MKMIDYELRLGDPRSFFDQILNKGVWTAEGLLSVEMCMYLLGNGRILLGTIPTLISGVDLSIYFNHPKVKAWATIEKCLRRKNLNGTDLIFDSVGRVRSKKFLYEEELIPTEKALLDFIRELSPKKCWKRAFTGTLIPSFQIEIGRLIETSLSQDIYVNPVLLALLGKTQGKIAGPVLEGDEKLVWDYLRKERYWEKHPIASLDQAADAVLDAVRFSWTPRKSTIKTWIRNSGLQPQTAKVRGLNKDTLRLKSIISC
jgi:hypothetical protein